MAWIAPIVVSRRKGGRSNPIALIAGLVIFLIFGVFFLVFFNRSGMMMGFNFPIIFIILGFIVFLMIISGISIAASSISKSYKPPKDNIKWQNQTKNQQQTVQKNPYIIQKPIAKKVDPQYKENPTEVVSIVSEINFCRYCGQSVEDKIATFCHQCGNKL